MKDKNLARFLLTIFLGWLGSFIINHSSLKPEGHTSRTAAYFFLSMFTFGLYPLVAAFCNLSFDPERANNIGYKCTARVDAYPYAPIVDEPSELVNAPHASELVENLYVAPAPTPAAIPEAEEIPVIAEAPVAAVDDSRCADDSMTVDESMCADEANS